MARRAASAQDIAPDIAPAPARLNRSIVWRAMALAPALTAFALAWAARGFWSETRSAFAARFRVTVALERNASDARIEQVRQAIEALPGVAEAAARDWREDQRLFFAGEPWAGEFQSAAQTRFLPPLLSVAFADPFADAGYIGRLAERIRSLDGVEFAEYSAEGQQYAARALSRGKRAIEAAMAVFAAFALLSAWGFEAIIRQALDSAAAAAPNRVYAAARGGALAGLLACAFASAIAEWLSRWADLPGLALNAEGLAAAFGLGLASCVAACLLAKAGSIGRRPPSLSIRLQAGPAAASAKAGAPAAAPGKPAPPPAQPEEPANPASLARAQQVYARILRESSSRPKPGSKN
ncbi:MAG: hypothetical protein BWZ10_01790 [candidate division BRC1 bacterium ADurb.BinA364]|nr:MAG: hypothetical protein BWZ10_01790 [candidate division BRC1 bacterium ADurb.BinA364]